MGGERAVLLPQKGSLVPQSSHLPQGRSTFRRAGKAHVSDLVAIQEGTNLAAAGFTGPAVVFRADSALLGVLEVPAVTVVPHLTRRIEPVTADRTGRFAGGRGAGPHPSPLPWRYCAGVGPEAPFCPPCRTFCLGQLPVI